MRLIYIRPCEFQDIWIHTRVMVDENISRDEDQASDWVEMAR